MKIISLSLILLLAGCATNSVESRKKEKRVAYQGLSPGFKALVDQGQIEKGMSEEAVYVAWGKPTEILEMETAQGPFAKWLYKGIYLQQEQRESVRPDPFGSIYTYDPSARGSSLPYQRPPTLEKKSVAHDYVKYEVNFLNGIVTGWSERARPR